MKLFGKGAKLNIIDWILVLIVIAAIIFVAVRFLTPDSDALNTTGTLSTPNLRYVVVCESLNPELANSIQAAVEASSTDYGGQALDAARLYNSNKLVDAKIVSVALAEPGEDGRITLSFTIEGNALLSDGAYCIGTQEVRIGKDYNVKTLDAEIMGYVSVMEKLK